MEKKLYSSPCTGIQSHPITQCKSHTTVFSYTCNHAPSTVLLSERFFSLYYKGFFYKLIRRVDLRFYSHPQICHVARATGLAECIFGARAQLASLGASAISTPASTGLQKLPVGAVGDKVRCGAIAPPRPPPSSALGSRGAQRHVAVTLLCRAAWGSPPRVSLISTLILRVTPQTIALLSQKKRYGHMAFCYLRLQSINRPDFKRGIFKSLPSRTIRPQEIHNTRFTAGLRLQVSFVTTKPKVYSLLTKLTALRNLVCMK